MIHGQFGGYDGDADTLKMSVFGNVKETYHAAYFQTPSSKQRSFPNKRTKSESKRAGCESKVLISGLRKKGKNEERVYDCFYLAQC